MVAVIAFVLAIITSLFPVKSDAQMWTAHYNPDAEAVFIASEKAKRIGDGDKCTMRGECSCIGCYDMDVFIQAYDDFTALFNATEVKWAKNGRVMVKGAHSNSFKFAPKGK